MFFASICWRLFFYVFITATVVSSNDADQTCENPDGCFAKAPTDAKYVSEGVYFPSNYFLKVPILSIKDETDDTKIITFGLPPDQSLGITISSAIMMNVPKGDGKFIARPYNPINFQKEGSFDLLIKIYEEGLAGMYVSTLKVGDLVEFKQTKGNVKKFQFPFEGVEKITMVAGGTGIAPMYQALVPLLEQTSIDVRLLYSNKTPEDIILKEELDALASSYADRFTIHYILGRDEDDTRYGYYTTETGWIDETRIRRLGFPSSASNNSVVVWVCGVDDMYKSLAGSRLKALTEGSPLHNLGYTDKTVWRS